MAAERDADERDADVPIVVHPPVTGDRDGDTPVVVQIEPFDADGAVPSPEQTPPAGPDASMEPKDRAAGLDAFRGLYLLAMNFAFTIPAGVFAQWMYHVQYPSPSLEFAPIPGLGWRDTLFGGFLFAMAAALPITMGRRLEKGSPYPRVLYIALRRGFLLWVFALIIGHVNPYWTGDMTKRGNVMAMIGFVVCAWLFTRARSDWNPRVVGAVRMAGWAAAALLLFWGPSFYGESFSLARRDDIIASIAFTAVIGTAIWLLTRTNLLARLAVIAVVLALKLAARDPGWVQDLWAAPPLPWLFEAWYVELLLIVVPGTIAGDLLNRWMRPAAAGGAALTWSRYRLALIALASVALLVVVLVGTYTRAVTGTTVLVLGLGIGGSLLCLPATTERERVLARLFWWGAFWLGLGMLLEPFEGGIKKVPQTLSYLFVSAGLSSVILLACVIVADAFGARRRLLRPLVEVGQNPMLAYVVYMLFLNHLLYLLGVGDFLSGSATAATLRGFIVALGTAAVIWSASRARLYWRA